MKKILSAFLSLTLALSCICSLGITANAQTELTPNATNGNTPMSITGTAISQPTYTVVIPAKVDFGSIERTKESNIKAEPLTVSATGISNLFANEKKLVISVASTNSYNLSDGATSPNLLSYKLYTAYTDETTNTPLSNGTIFEMVGTADKDTNLTKTVNGAVTIDTQNIKKAGLYTDILTFTVALLEVNVK